MLLHWLLGNRMDTQPIKNSLKLIHGKFSFRTNMAVKDNGMYELMQLRLENGSSVSLIFIK